MTKKHFIALARHIKYHNAYSTQKFRYKHIEALAAFCKGQNSHFNLTRWLAYIASECGPNGGTIPQPKKPRYITPERKLARRLEGK